MKRTTLVCLCFLFLFSSYASADTRLYKYWLSTYDRSFRFNGEVDAYCKQNAKYFRVYYGAGSRIDRVDSMLKGSIYNTYNYAYPSASSKAYKQLETIDHKGIKIGSSKYIRDADAMITRVESYDTSDKLSSYTLYTYGDEQVTWRSFSPHDKLKSKGTTFYNEDNVAFKAETYKGKFKLVKRYDPNTGHQTEAKRYRNDKYNLLIISQRDDCGRLVTVKGLDPNRDMRLFAKKTYDDGLVVREDQYNTSGTKKAYEFLYDDHRGVKSVKYFVDDKHLINFFIERRSNRSIKRTVARDLNDELLAEYPDASVYHVDKKMKCVNCNDSKVYKIPNGLK